MKVLITGAAGFLGRHFWQYHEERGDIVVGIDDMSAPAGPPFNPSTFIQEDAGRWFEHNAVSPHRIYHFAAPVGGRLKIERDPFFNADATRFDIALFKWAVKTKPGVIVYPSSSAVYGKNLQGSNHSVALAEAAFNPADAYWNAPDELYGTSKLFGEYLAWKAASYGVNTLCIRPFSGYGEWQKAEYPITAICQRALKKENPLHIWGSGHQKRDFVHVSDIIGATMARLDAGQEGYQAMNIGKGNGISFIDVAHVAAEIVGYKPEIVADTDQPEGVFNRYADITEMSRYYQPQVQLKQGLAKVMKHLMSRG